MILFKEDWDKYPSAIADYETSNKSFLRLAQLYKSMGISNNNFFLALLDQSLIDVNPFDPNLTLEQMAAITVECKLNFWYFLREIARAPAISGSDSIPVRANRGNIALYWLFFNHVTTMLIQIRQTGKTFSSELLTAYLLNIRCNNTQLNLITKDEKLRGATIRRIKNIDSEFPFYLRQRSKKDANNSENITVNKLNNQYNTHIAQQSIKAAENAGRGLTSPFIHADEVAYLYNVGISLPVAFGSMGAVVDIAKANNEPYGIILTTTAGKKDDRDGKYAYSLMTNAAVYSEKFFDVQNQDELYNVIRKNSTKGELRVNCTFSHRQLGYTDEWLREKIETVGGSKESIQRDFFNEWTDGGLGHPLTVQQLKVIRDSQINDFYGEISNAGYITRWYLEEHEIQSYMCNNSTVLALDPSDAGGGDDISLVLLNITNGKVLAAGNYNETNLIMFSEWLFTWFEKYPLMTGIIERRSSGSAILDYLILKMVNKGMDPFKRLFNRVVNDKDEFPDRYKLIELPVNRRPLEAHTQLKKHFGFATSGSGLTSRTELYSTTLQSASKLIGNKVYDKTIIDQIAGLTSKNGRVDHQPGEHDDSVIAWLLAYWFISLGRNLWVYGINPRMVLTDVKDISVNLSALEIYNKQEQLEIRRQIEEIYDRMLEERDPSILRNYESKIKFLSSKLILEDNETFSVADFMQSLEEEKKIKFIDKDPNYHINYNNMLTETSYTEDLFNLRDPFYRRY